MIKVITNQIALPIAHRFNIAIVNGQMLLLNAFQILLNMSISFLILCIKKALICECYSYISSKALSKISSTFIKSETENEKLPNNTTNIIVEYHKVSELLKQSAIIEKIDENINPIIVISNLSNNFLSVFNCLNAFINLEFGKDGIREKLANKNPVANEAKDKIPEITAT